VLLTFVLLTYRMNNENASHTKPTGHGK